jgi:hypothetical protein
MCRTNEEKAGRDHVTAADLGWIPIIHLKKDD